MSARLHLSDRMPAVAAGLARWSPPEAEHLTACEECRTEWALVRQTAVLGAEIEGSLDLERVEAGVLAGLRTPARRWVRRPLAWLVPLAAAAAVAILVLRGTGSVPAEPEVPALLPELETLSSSQLESILPLLPRTATRSVDGFEDLTESELSSVLKDLEG